ncbi:MAG TPA: thioredoxin-disulfide reductase [Candidatus Absconditabacterales bacterium]|nr:thioredoxin-disulfide reductase [Candidatus Absconditabacterales bacterium]HNG96862.1 thioredoxin-disulfide reductase [Candidatus Absconditabacterales bacterium]
MMYSLIIIGSGPAGHTAAIYAARANLNPLMFEGFFAGDVAAGGQLTTTTEVENFPGFPHGIDGTQLMNQMREQSIRSGTTILTQTVDRVDLSRNNSDRALIVYAQGHAYKTQTLIIATGATAKKLEIPGLKTYRNNGISGCAVCDGALPLFRNKPLAVIGGGDVAMEEAMHLSKFGSHVYLLVRSDKLRASKAMQERVLSNPKITILWNTECIKADGDGEILKSLEISDNQTKSTKTLDVGGLFFAIGHTPNTGFLEGQVVVDEHGYIVATNTKTSVSGVFAAGDVADKVYRQAITSAGTGCMAALEAEKWLSEGRE